MITQAPRGTYDLYGVQAAKWRMIEEEIYRLMKEFCYSEIRTPIFEHTELFQRGVGDTTDIVQKEMYYPEAGRNGGSGQSLSGA